MPPPPPLDNAIVDSLGKDDITRFLDEALNRLEEVTNQSLQALKQSKVDTWAKSIRERMANGLYGDEKPRFPVDDSDEDEGSGEGEADEFGVVRPSQPTNSTERGPVQGFRGPLSADDGKPGTKPSMTDLHVPKNDDLVASTSRLHIGQTCMTCR